MGIDLYRGNKCDLYSFINYYTDIKITKKVIIRVECGQEMDFDIVHKFLSNLVVAIR